MSGGIAQLVAVGAQDIHLVGNPEISFFRSQYKRHTNFATFVDKQVVQGTQGDNNMVSVRVERKGDLLGAIYLTAVYDDASDYNDNSWYGAIDKVELLIGGQIIDTMHMEWNEYLWGDLMAQTQAQAQGIMLPALVDKAWSPLHFWFCENPQCALPLVALQYHDVELRIHLDEAFNSVFDSDSGGRLECYSRYYTLDTPERDWFVSQPHELLITQIQKINAVDSQVMDLNFSHPIKFIAGASEAFYDAGDINTINDNAAGCAFNSDDTRMRLQINGTDLNKPMFSNPHFTACTRYYTAPYGNTFKPGMANDDYRSEYGWQVFLYPFCLDTSKFQPTGTLNFSRVDNARFIAEGGVDVFMADLFACNYNILKVQNGMGGLMYAN